MLEKDFHSVFHQQTLALSPRDGLSLAIAVSKRQYVDYESFVLAEGWGDKDLLLDAIQLCEQAKTRYVARDQVQEMHVKVNAITPQTINFRHYSGLYASNAAASVHHALKFLLDEDPRHMYYIGGYLVETIEFKLFDKERLTGAQCDQHPMMVEARNFLLDLTKNYRRPVASQNNGRSTAFSTERLVRLGIVFHILRKVFSG